jgi:hypothetical protein
MFLIGLFFVVDAIIYALEISRTLIQSTMHTAYLCMTVHYNKLDPLVLY